MRVAKWWRRATLSAKSCRMIQSAQLDSDPTNSYQMTVSHWWQSAAAARTARATALYNVEVLSINQTAAICEDA